MRRIGFIMLFSFICNYLYPQSNSDVLLYDSKGYPDAYISDGVIYLWNGTPTAYLDYSIFDNNILTVYSFSGEHLGWYEDGMLLDKQSNVVGFKEGAIISEIHTKSNRGYKKPSPVKYAKETEDVKAPYTGYFSSIPLRNFLSTGSSSDSNNSRLGTGKSSSGFSTTFGPSPFREKLKGYESIYNDNENENEGVKIEIPDLSFFNEVPYDSPYYQKLMTEKKLLVDLALKGSAAGIDINNPIDDASYDYSKLWFEVYFNAYNLAKKAISEYKRNNLQNIGK